MAEATFYNTPGPSADQTPNKLKRSLEKTSPKVSPPDKLIKTDSGGLTEAQSPITAMETIQTDTVDNSPVVESIITALSSPEFMATFEKIIDKCVTKHFGPLASTIQDQAKQIDFLEKKVDKLSYELNQSVLKVDELEQYDRRNSLRLSVNTKEEDVENTDEIVVNVAKKLGVDIECSDISRSHRVGRPGSKPRPILVKFVSYRMREKLYSNRKKMAKNTYISEDLTRYRQGLFYKARHEQKKGVFSHAWTKDGRVLARLQGGRVIVIREPCDLLAGNKDGDQQQQKGVVVTRIDPQAGQEQ